MDCITCIDRNTYVHTYFRRRHFEKRTSVFHAFFLSDLTLLQYSGARRFCNRMCLCKHIVVYTCPQPSEDFLVCTRPRIFTEEAISLLKNCIDGDIRVTANILCIAATCVQAATAAKIVKNFWQINYFAAISSCFSFFFLKPVAQSVSLCYIDIAQSILD